MWRSLQSLDQQLAGSRALQAIEFVRVDNHHGIAAMQRDVLRPIAVRHAHEFAESRLSVLKAPSTTRRLRGRYCQGWCFSSHADQNITAPRGRQRLGLPAPDADIRDQTARLLAHPTVRGQTHPQRTVGTTSCWPLAEIVDPGRRSRSEWNLDSRVETGTSYLEQPSKVSKSGLRQGGTNYRKVSAATGSSRPAAMRTASKYLPTSSGR